MFVHLFMGMLFGRELVKVYGVMDEIKAIKDRVKDASYLESGQGGKIRIEHSNRTFLFDKGDEDKAVRSIDFVNKFDTTYSDMLEIVSSVRKLRGESEHDEIKGGRRSFAIFFVDENSISKLGMHDKGLKVFMSTDKELAKSLNTPFPGIYGYDSHDKVEYSLRVSNDYSRAASTITMPLLEIVTSESMQAYEQSENPTFYILSQPQDYEELRRRFLEVAREMRNDAQICFMMYKEGAIDIEKIGLEVKDLPAIMIIRDGLTYRVSDATPEKVRGFIRGFLDKTLEHFILSENEPEDNEKRTVKRISYNGSKKWLEDKTKDKLVVFHAPWCRFCRELSPVIEELGVMVQRNAGDKVMVGTFDMTKNQALEGLEVRGYPTIYLIRAETNEKVLFKGERSAKSLSSFIKTSGYHKVDLGLLEEEPAKTEL